jgi:hypothetical protein
MNSKHEMIAHVDAMNVHSAAEIASMFGIEVNTVYQIRLRPDYKLAKKQAEEEIKERLIAQASDRVEMLNEAFNNEAMPAFETVKSLHKMADKDATRLNAAFGILDRASDAPKVLKNVQNIDNRTIIQIPIKTMNEANKALKEIGREDVIDLLPMRSREVKSAPASQVMSIEEWEEQEGMRV